MRQSILKQDKAGKEDKNNSFFITQFDATLMFYIDVLWGIKFSFFKRKDQIKEGFHSPTRPRALLPKQKSLAKIIAVIANSTNKSNACLTVLSDRLNTIHALHLGTNQNRTILGNKLLKFHFYNFAYSLSLWKSAELVGGLILDLHASFHHCNQCRWFFLEKYLKTMLITNFSVTVHRHKIKAITDTKKMIKIVSSLKI